MDPNQSIGSKVVTGTAWMVAARWCMRCIGLVSTVILARLLTPADFGIIAIAMIVVGLVEVFAETGIAQALIRHPDPTREHFDTAWTLQIILGLGISIVLVVSAPLATLYFDDPRVETVIQLLALRSLIQGFENPGIIWFRKNMEFNKDFRLLVWRRGIRFCVVVILALILRNYWALVFAMISTKVISLILTYIMHPFRPKLSLVKTGDIWGYSLWMLVVHIGIFLNTKVDEIILGGLSNTTAVGHYYVASDVARLPTEELYMPISRVLFSAYSQLSEDRQALESAFHKAFSTIVTLCCAVGVGTAIVAEDIVAILLGSQWIAATPVVYWIALSTVILSITASMVNVLSSMGKARASALISWSRLLVLVPVLVPLARTGDISWVAAGRFAVLAVFFVPTLLYFTRVAKFSLFPIVHKLFRPLGAAALMALGVSALDSLVPDPTALRLVLKISAGALIYCSTVLISWHMAGRPDGIEDTALDIGKKVWISVRARIRA